MDQVYAWHQPIVDFDVFGGRGGDDCAVVFQETLRFINALLPTTF
jgi:hypothetical protein